MKPLIRATSVLIVTLFVSGPGVAEDDSGEQLYHRYGCVWCHGHFGHGGGAGGPRTLAPSPYALEAFAVFVRTPQRLMPPYPTDLLSDADLQSIYDFVQSIDASPDADEIPQLIEMRERYRKMD